MSFIFITQKPMVLNPLPLSDFKIKDLKLESNNSISRRRTSVYLISLLAFWAGLNIFGVLVPPLDYIPVRHQREQDHGEEFWKWEAAPPVVPRALTPCLNFSESYRKVGAGLRMPRKYMMVVVSGGLNQQRNQIVDAVVVARIVGAALVLPVFQVNQVWGDESQFPDIFDDRHFKEVLRDDVVVVSSLPATHVGKRRVRGPVMPFHASEDWIRSYYGNKLSKNSILLIRAFDSKLSKDLSADLQKLRTKVAFEALKFQPWIEAAAERLVQRIRQGGPYMALHLRLEKDVWVRTGCHSGLGKEADMVIENERASKPRLLTSRSRLTARDRYLAGLCPLNARELSRFLKGLGTPKSARIYWAGGEPFGGQKALEPLQVHFPNVYNKWSLSDSGELNGLEHKPSILAALDYVVCLKSPVFMANHGGNMANSLQGHRTYMGYGKHIKPNKKTLVQLFLNKSLHEAEIAKEIKRMHLHTEVYSS